ncbi:MAG: tRNA pseudouridine(38-40) synthase TruA [Actinomycetes bacterium]
MVGGTVLVRVRLDLAYDGTGFHGWACQPGLRTVAGVLAEALGRALRVVEPVSLTVAGRTDAGVHARGQVAHTDLPPAAWERLGTAAGQDPGGRLVRRLAGLLPPDVRVRRAVRAPAGFDARFSALARRYAYRISTDAGGVDPLLGPAVVGWPRPLDVAAMARAGSLLLGEHDFAAFCRPRVGASTVRRLRRLDIVPTTGGLVTLGVESDAFCHHMVRGLVGVLLAVGSGSRPVDWPMEILQAGAGWAQEGRSKRHWAVQVAPARGLTLEAVAYPPDALLAAQADRSRVRRGPAHPVLVDREAETRDIDREAETR